MRTGEPLQVMRRWRLIILAGLLLGVVVGLASPPGTVRRTTYEATQTLILEPSGGQSSDINRAAVLATLGPVPARVAARLGMNRNQVQSMVSAGTLDAADELAVVGRSPDRARAEALANVTAEELIAELGGPASSLRTLEPAVASPVAGEDFQGPGSRPGRAALLGAFGLLLGIGAAFCVDRFDNRIRSKRVAEEALGVPVVAEVPPLPRGAGVRPADGPGAPAVVEAYRRLRTVVDRWAADGDGEAHRVIVVTAPGPGEGTTTTAVQLATALGEVGRSVLVVAGDLQRPDLHRWFDRPREPGLVDVLSGAPGAPEMADVIVGTGIRGVSFAPSGAPVGNPGPLLERAGDLLAAAGRGCDFVVVDSAPLLVSSDAAELAGRAGSVLLVIRAGRTAIGAARRSAEMLRRLDVPVLGAVLVGSDGAPTLPAGGSRRRPFRRARTTG